MLIGPHTSKLEANKHLFEDFLELTLLAVSFAVMHLVEGQPLFAAESTVGTGSAIRL